MLNSKAFDAALRVFNRTRAGMVDCLRAAIEAFKVEELKQVYADGNLTFYITDTDSGPDTALVITGFRDAADIDSFVRMGRDRASRE